MIYLIFWRGLTRLSLGDADPIVREVVRRQIIKTRIGVREQILFCKSKFCSVGQAVLEDARPDQDWLKIVSILVPGISFSLVMDK